MESTEKSTFIFAPPVIPSKTFHFLKSKIESRRKNEIKENVNLIQKDESNLVETSETETEDITPTEANSSKINEDKKTRNMKNKDEKSKLNSPQNDDQLNENFSQ